MEHQPKNALEQQAFDLTGCILSLARAVLAEGFPKAGMDVTLQEARSLDVLGRKDAWTMTEFAAELGVTLPTASHAAARLVKKRMVRRSRSANDRRIVLILLSTKGLARHRAILQSRIRVCGELLRRLTPAQRHSAMAEIHNLAALALERLTKSKKESYETV